MTGRDDRSDADLAAAIADGDERAFESLYRRHRDWVIALAWRFSGSREESLDIAQESFIWLMKRLGPHDPGPSGEPFELRAAMRTVLYPVVRSIAFTRRRRDRTREIHIPGIARLAQADAEAAPSGSADLERHERLRALSAALDRLSDDHREVILMRFVDDLSLEEIAQALAIPLGTVKSRLHAAIKALRAADARAGKN